MTTSKIVDFELVLRTLTVLPQALIPANCSEVCMVTLIEEATDVSVTVCS